jgi:hypothetical protein
MHCRECELLGTDVIHTATNDVGDLVVNLQAEREQRIMTRVKLTDEATANEQLVADRLGVTRGVSQCGDEQLGPAHMRRRYRVRRSGDANFNRGFGSIP